MTIRVAIADDHQLVREGLKRILASDSEIVVTYEVASGIDLISQLNEHACDVLLLDISMPGSGIELITTLRERMPALQVLVVSMHNDVQIVRRALQAGASGYIDKSCSTDVLVSAIRTVAGGERFIDPCLINALIFESEPLQLPPHQQLSPREYEVLRLIAAGHSGSAIAELLFLSPKTVSTHKKRMMQKLNAANNSALIQYAISHNLVDQH